MQLLQNSAKHNIDTVNIRPELSVLLLEENGHIKQTSHKRKLC